MHSNDYCVKWHRIWDKVFNGFRPYCSVLVIGYAGSSTLMISKLILFSFITSLRLCYFLQLRIFQRHRGTNALESTSVRQLMAIYGYSHNERDSVSNHQPHDCLLNRLFRRRSKKTSKLRVTGLCAGNHRWPVNSPHKWPVTLKIFLFDDVIMQTKSISVAQTFAAPSLSSVKQFRQQSNSRAN